MTPKAFGVLRARTTHRRRHRRPLDGADRARVHHDQRRTDVTSAAYTIKGVLDTARTYAKANNTYSWVGFYEENVANPASPNSDTPAVGRIIISIIASKDGTMLYTGNLPVLWS